MSDILTQKEAVYTSTLAVLYRNKIAFSDKDDILSVMTSSMRADITEAVCDLFRRGKVSLKESDSNNSKLNDERELKRYVASLITNWFRKDGRLNGGTTFKIAKPGIKAGFTDEELKALRVVKKRFEALGETKKVEEIQKYIDEKTASINKEKTKAIAAKAKLNIDNIPPELAVILEE
jgi:vacuolar-type H+-ATPase subunit I/STV1